MWLWRLTRQNILLSLFSHKWQWHTKQNRDCYCRPFPPSQIKPITTKLHQCRHHGQTQCGFQWLKLAENKFTLSYLTSFSNQVSRSKWFRFWTVHCMSLMLKNFSKSRHKFDHITLIILLKSNFWRVFAIWPNSVTLQTAVAQSVAKLEKFKQAKSKACSRLYVLFLET